MSSKPKRASRAKKAERKVEVAAKEVEEEVAKAEKAIKKEVKALGASKPRPAVARPAGHAPMAMVQSRHGVGMISRRAKGFSHGELSSAGIQGRLATRWGASVDHRRRSVLEGNVSSLKQWGNRQGPAAAAKRDIRSAELKAEGAVKEAKVDVEVIGEEAKEVERSAKKEMKKIEAAVKEKVDKPRPRKKKDSA